jgi:hypothetical protein
MNKNLLDSLSVELKGSECFIRGWKMNSIFELDSQAGNDKTKIARTGCLYLNEQSSRTPYRIPTDSEFEAFHKASSIIAKPRFLKLFNLGLLVVWVDRSFLNALRKPKFYEEILDDISEKLKRVAAPKKMLDFMFYPEVENISKIDVEKLLELQMDLDLIIIQLPNPSNFSPVYYEKRIYDAFNLLKVYKNEVELMGIAKDIESVRILARNQDKFSCFGVKLNPRRNNDLILFSVQNYLKNLNKYTHAFSCQLPIKTGGIMNKGTLGPFLGVRGIDTTSSYQSDPKTRQKFAIWFSNLSDKEKEMRIYKCRVFDSRDYSMNTVEVAFHELCQEGNLPPYAIGKEVGIWNGKRY